MPVRLARRSWRCLLVAGLALLLASGLTACGGSSDDDLPPAAAEIAPPTREPDDPSLPEPPLPPPETTPPVPEPPADPTPTDTDALAPAIATPDSFAEADTPAPIEADLPPPIMPLTESATGPAVSLTGPLLVLSERVDAEQTSDDHEIEIRRVSLYDVGTERYWVAFDYRSVRLLDWPSTDLSAVQPAGTGLIVWSVDQIHRVSLSGHSEALLFEHDAIRAIRVSPDGTHVAILYGEPGTLVALDALTGAEVLRVTSDDPALGPLRNGGPYELLSMGDWRADGNALSLTARSPTPTTFFPPYTVILELDGTIRVLPENRFLSPDLRYAIRFGEIIEWSARTGHAPLWDRWEVFDVETGRLLRTIADEDGIQRPYGQAPLWQGQSKYVAFNWRLLDIATGEILEATASLRRMLESPVRTSCETTVGTTREWRYSVVCAVRYEGRVVWEGGDEWTRYHGLIELPGSFALSGITLLDIVREPTPPSPPPRHEMVGPLFVYQVFGGFEDYPDSEILDSHSFLYSFPTWHVIVYDEGTGRSWSLGDFAWIQTARGGIVALRHAPFDYQILFLAPDGQSVKLYDRVPSPQQLSGFTRRTQSRSFLRYSLVSRGG